MNRFDYYEFRRNRIAKKVSTELEYYRSIRCQESCKPYIEYLRNRIEEDKNIIVPLTCCDKKGNTFEIKKMDMDEYLRDIGVSVYQQSWKKLKHIHKMKKIEEYIENLSYTSNNKEKIEKNKRDILKELEQFLIDKNFSKRKDLFIYDEENGKIVDINYISYNKKKKIYHIEW